MRAEGQHANSENDILRPRISAMPISWKRVALYASLSIGFFALGFVPMWIKEGRAIEQRNAAQREVRLIKLKNTLETAVVDVQRGQYEPARQLASEFYTSLRSQIDDDAGSVFTRSQREQLRSLLSERDDLITLLARRDPAATDRLYAVYSSYNKMILGAENVSFRGAAARSSKFSKT